MSEPTPERAVLVLDVGGNNVKLIATGQSERRKVASGPDLTPQRMVPAVKREAAAWDYEVVSIGFPAPVRHGRLMEEPINLGQGWVDFDFEAAFERPVRILNDAAMQALGSYPGDGCMLFLGLGTGLGSAMVTDWTVLPMELGHLPYRDGKSFEDIVGRAGLEELGESPWIEAVLDVLGRLTDALQPDYVVLGGGNTKRLGELPAGVMPGHNDNAFTGGFRMWEDHSARGR